MEPNRPEMMLFALLRTALNATPPDPVPFGGASPSLWQTCYAVAVKQGVMALAWDGVTALPVALQPPKTLKLNWAMAVERYEARYRRYCQTVTELSGYYSRHGIAAVQLKGVGFSVYYPVPSRREGGDIDLFTYSADRTKRSDTEANRLADRLMQEQGINVDTSHSRKHSVFFYKGIPVENHKTFLDTATYRIAARTEGLLRDLLQPGSVVLAGKYTVQVPSPAFNTLFLAFHAAQHYACGLALHHLCDWACLLNRHGLHIPDGITDRRLKNMLFALTRLCNRYLGTGVPVQGGEELAEQMLGQILRAPYSKEVPVRKKRDILVYKTKRLLHTHRLCNSVLGVSLAKWIVRSIVLHVRFPHTIFKTGAE